MNRAKCGEANRGNEAVPVDKGVRTPAESRMGSPSRSAATTEIDWTNVLIGILQDPERVRGLHSLLGPYCHQSRNLLNGLKIGLYIARSKDRSRGDRPEGGTRWDELDRLYQAVEQRFDRIQSICRPMDVSTVRLPLSLLVDERQREWIDRFQARGRVLKLVAPRPGEDEPGNYDPNLLGQALDAFVEWRADAGTKGQGARLGWWTRGGRIHLEWVESRRKVATLAGAGPDANETPSPLAFPMLIRVIVAHGGSFERIDPDGRQLRSSWPQVHEGPRTS